MTTTMGSGVATASPSLAAQSLPPPSLADYHEMEDRTMTSSSLSSSTLPPSRVLFLKPLPQNSSEETVRELVSKFGTVETVIFIRRKTLKALVQMSDLQEAENMVNLCATRPLVVLDTKDEEDNCPVPLTVHVTYSKRQSLSNQWKSNHMLLLTIQVPKFPITTLLLHRVFSRYGTVHKIVIFLKSVGLQALVQFETEAQATEAKRILSGQCLYDDCCKLVITYSNLSELTVKENSLRTRDFMNPHLPVPAVDTAVDPLQDIAATTRHANLHGISSLPSAVPSEVMVGSPVLLVGNLHESVSCDHLFNLFSCYGNVHRVRKLHNRSDHALVQMENYDAVRLAITHLRGFRLFRQSLDIRESKHWYISRRNNNVNNGASADDEDHVTITSNHAEGESAAVNAIDASSKYKEFSRSLNRFNGKYASSKKYIHNPTRTLHLSNLDKSVDDETLLIHLQSFGASPMCMKRFASKTGQEQVLMQFVSIDEATDVLARGHNTLLAEKHLKLAFSTNTIKTTTGGDQN